MAQIHTTISLNSYAILVDVLDDQGDQEIDRASMEIVWRGTEAALRARFPKGAENYPRPLPVGARMLCAGVRVTRNQFGYIWARVEWEGFLEAPSSLAAGGGRVSVGAALLSLKNWTNSSTTTELALPISVENGETSILVTGAAPYNATGALARSRQRIINPAWAMTLEGVMIVSRNLPPSVPKLVGFTRPLGLSDEFNSAAPNSGAAAISQANWFDGITPQGGWLVRDFQSSNTRILGQWLILKWTLRAEWIDRFSPA
jgi:hypothetical protein